MSANVVAAFEAHRQWIDRFHKAVAARSLPADLRCASYDDQCPLGQWLYSLDDATKASDEYRLVKDRHYQFHNEAGEVLQLMEQGLYEAAQAVLVDSFTAASLRLREALVSWQAKQSA